MLSNRNAQHLVPDVRDAGASLGSVEDGTKSACLDVLGSLISSLCSELRFNNRFL